MKPSIVRPPAQDGGFAKVFGELGICGSCQGILGVPTQGRDTVEPPPISSFGATRPRFIAMKSIFLSLEFSVL